MKYSNPQDPSMSIEAVMVAPKNMRMCEFGHSRRPGHLTQCYVPVVDGQSFKIVCKIARLTKGSIVDLVVDGILRDTYVQRFIPRKHYGVVIFEKGIFARAKSLITGKLTARAWRQQIKFSDGDAKLGTIQVRLYRKSTDDNICHRGVPDPTEMPTYKDVPLPWNSYGIVPDCEIYFEGRNVLPQAERNALKRDFHRGRPGRRPSAIMQFIYRTAELLRVEKVIESKDKERTPLLVRMVLESSDSSDDDEEEVEVERSAGQQSSPATGCIKRRLSEISDYEDYVAISTANLAQSQLKRSAGEMARLRAEVERWQRQAEQRRRHAAMVRSRLAENFRREAEQDNEVQGLMEQKTRAQAEVMKYNRNLEVYEAKLVNHRG